MGASIVAGTDGEQTCVSRVSIYPQVPDTFALQVTRSCNPNFAKPADFTAFPRISSNDHDLRQGS